jgi:hypothetical protein
MSSAGVFAGRWRITALIGLSDFGLMREVSGFEVSPDGRKFCHFLKDNSRSVPGRTELEASFHNPIQLLLQRNKVDLGGEYNGGGLPIWLDAACCCCSFWEVS